MRDHSTRRVPALLSVCFLAFTGSALAQSTQPADTSADETQAAEQSVTDAEPAETFEPIMEAPLPEGYPMPGPIGVAVLKQYPPTRLAVAEGRGAFMRLFNHINSREIAMTTPVEMGGRNPETGQTMARRERMAFFYRHVEQAPLGDDARHNVEVIDDPAYSAVAFAIRGPVTERKRQRAMAAIEALLAEQSEWVATGEVREFGYNSPGILPWNRTNELHAVVEPVESKRLPPPAPAAP